LLLELPDTNGKISPLQNLLAQIFPVEMTRNRLLMNLATLSFRHSGVLLAGIHNGLWTHSWIPNNDIRE